MRRVNLLIALIGVAACTEQTEEVEPQSFYWMVMADTHVIDEYYEGPEGSAYDSETILLSNDRLEQTRKAVNQLPLPLDFGVVVGDVIHDYPSNEYSFYEDQNNRPAIDIARDSFRKFDIPIYLGLGNHDYNVPQVSHDFTHRLFKEKFGIEPYYAWDHMGWRFIHLNSQLGNTWNPGHEDYAKSLGSLGEEQLLWLDEQLSANKPSFVFVHHHPFSFKETEFPDGIFEGLDDVLNRHPGTVQLTISGHLHRWVDLESKIIIGATRFDEDAYFIIRCNPNRTYEILNWDSAHWVGSHEDGFRGTIDTWTPTTDDE